MHVAAQENRYMIVHVHDVDILNLNHLAFLQAGRGADCDRIQTARQHPKGGRHGGLNVCNIGNT